MKKKALSIVFILLIFTSCLFETNKPFRWASKVFGTTYHITFYKEELEAKGFADILKDIESILKEIDRQMSTWRNDSEISRFNSLKAGEWFEISPDFYFVLSKSIDVYKKSKGAFDPTIFPVLGLWGLGPKHVEIKKLPSTDTLIHYKKNVVGADKIKMRDGKIYKSHPDLKIDLSAIAKGHAVDLISEYLIKNKVDNFFIEIGGEVRAYGKNKNEKWIVGIEAPGLSDHIPQSRKDIYERLNLENMAMASSGEYKNYYYLDGQRISHTIDPRDLKPIDHSTVQVNVLSKTCLIADAYATAVNVLGLKEGLKLANELNEFEVRIVTYENNTFKVSKSKNFPEGLN